MLEIWLVVPGCLGIDVTSAAGVKPSLSDRSLGQCLLLPDSWVLVLDGVNKPQCSQKRRVTPEMRGTARCLRAEWLASRVFVSHSHDPHWNLALEDWCAYA
jgi:hypothetical protein